MSIKFQKNINSLYISYNIYDVYIIIIIIIIISDVKLINEFDVILTYIYII